MDWKEEMQHRLACRVHTGSWLEYLLKQRYTGPMNIKKEIQERITGYERCDDLTPGEKVYLAKLRKEL